MTFMTVLHCCFLMGWEEDAVQAFKPEINFNQSLMGQTNWHTYSSKYSEMMPRMFRVMSLWLIHGVHKDWPEIWSIHERFLSRVSKREYFKPWASILKLWYHNEKLSTSEINSWGKNDTCDSDEMVKVLTHKILDQNLNLNCLLVTSTSQSYTGTYDWKDQFLDLTQLVNLAMQSRYYSSILSNLEHSLCPYRNFWQGLCSEMWNKGQDKA